MKFRINRSRAYLKKYSLILNSVIFPWQYFVYQKKDYLYHRISFSQEGEDILLDRVFSGQTFGFFVDVGAHHPQRFSNTYLFYLKGWRGINIDATPGSMNEFRRLRPEDINLEIAISNQEGEFDYYLFNEPALNSFSKTISESRNNSTDYRVVKKKS